MIPHDVSLLYSNLEINICTVDLYHTCCSTISAPNDRSPLIPSGPSGSRLLHVTIPTESLEAWWQAQGLCATQCVTDLLPTFFDNKAHSRRKQE